MLSSEKFEPLSLVRCYPIGVIIMEDGGAKDEKIIAIPFNDPMYNKYQDIRELPGHIFEEMSHFFSVYKQLETGKETDIDDVRNREEAVKIITACLDRYLEDFCR